MRNNIKYEEVYIMWKITEDRNKRVEIFKDTLAYIKENETLSKAVEKSIKNTKFYSEDDYGDLPDANKECCFSVSGERTFESAIRLKKENPEKKVAVLNFASAVNPGGGVVKGAGAQEECLCRTSTLYPLLNTKELRKLYYEPNKKTGDNLHTDDVIYTPGVVICKTDIAFPERIPEQEFMTVDVLTCAAPNLNKKNNKRYSGDAPIDFDVSIEKQYEIHLKRCKHILSVAADNDVDILVLGAFGCGAFKNDPETVARAMHDACEEYSKHFDIINFAISCRNGKSTGNFEAFNRIFSIG